MTERKTLIEETAKAIWSADDTKPETWDNKNIVEWDRDTYRAMASAALAVFEKAHTPTDDEREALLAIVTPYFDRATDYDDGDRDDEGLVDEILAGFRRSEVPEPSADGVEGILDRATLDEYMRVDPDETYERLVVKANALASTVRRLLATSEPQGEPSDAQVDAAMRTLDPRGLGGREGMRAALRAAGEATR